MLAQPASAAMPARPPVSVIERLRLRSPLEYDALAFETAIPIAWLPLASNEVRFMSPTDSGSSDFRSDEAIGTPLPPVIAPIISPIALPAAALSPDFCADSMRLPASSMRLAISAMLPELMVTLAPSGVLMTTSGPAPAPRAARPPMPIRPIGENIDDTAARMMPAMMAQT